MPPLDSDPSAAASHSPSTPTKVAVLHPGSMGAAVAEALASNGLDVGWCADGRSPETARRAQALRRFDSLPELLSWAEAVFSIVPPHAAVETAERVASHNFSGLYIDANAIAPETARAVQSTVESAGASYIDGGIIGGPPRQRGDTRLYLSGPHAMHIAPLFDGSLFEALTLPHEDPRHGTHAASALKMTFAAWTKGSAALLLATADAAEGMGVLDALRSEWARSIPDLPDRLDRTRQAAPAKAWRFAGEMLEIARAFESAGQPGGFHLAAAETYQRIPRPPA